MRHRNDSRTRQKGIRMPKEKRKNVNTIFDDVFRTMIEKSPELIIPVINEVFQTSYAKDEKIVQLRNEHQTVEGEVITDSLFRIQKKTYHLECQSWPDSTMVIRMLEYDFYIALDNVRKENGEYVIEFPRSCVLYLRHNHNTSDFIKVKVKLPDGEACIYQIPIIKVNKYTKEDIFEKGLNLFLPFYILRYESFIQKFDGNEEALNAFIAEYEDICSRLQKEYEENGQVVLYIRLLELIQHVADYMLEKQPEMKERMDGVMGGHCINLKTDEIFEEGFAKGEAEGKAEGKAEGELIGRKRAMIEIIETVAATTGNLETACEMCKITKDEYWKAKKQLED